MTQPIETTLLDLVTAVARVTDDEAEILATVTHLVNSRRVVLCGVFAGRSIALER